MFRKALTRPLALAAILSVVLFAAIATTAFADTATPSPSPTPAAPSAAAIVPCSDPAHGTTCTTGSTNPITAAGNAITGAPGAVVGSLAGDATAGFTRWVAGGAAYVLDQSANWLQDATPPTLTSTWWKQHYASMRQLAMLLMFPFLMAAVIAGLARRNPAVMVQAFLIRAPLAFILTGAAVLLTTVALTASDEMTGMVAGPGMSGDTFAFMHNLSNSFTGSASSLNPTPLFLVAIAAILTVIAGLVMFLELLLRSGVIYIALLFMPIALAATVWPGAQRWAKRLAETLVAAILSKFVIVSVISLAVGALAVNNNPPAGGGGGSGGSSGDIGTLLTGVLLLGLAAFAPYKLFRILPAMETAAIGHMEGMRQRGMGGARAAVSAPRDALDRLSRQRATESPALAGKAIGGLGRTPGASAALVGGLAVTGAGMTLAGNAAGAGIGGGGGASSRNGQGGQAGGGQAGGQPPGAAGPPPPTHTPPSTASAAAASAPPPTGSPRG